jgi:hypothetical protein
LAVHHIFVSMFCVNTFSLCQNVLAFGQHCPVGQFLTFPVSAFDTEMFLLVPWMPYLFVLFLLCPPPPLPLPVVFTAIFCKTQPLSDTEKVISRSHPMESQSVMVESLFRPSRCRGYVFVQLQKFTPQPQGLIDLWTTMPPCWYVKNSCLKKLATFSSPRTNSPRNSPECPLRQILGRDITQLTNRRTLRRTCILKLYWQNLTQMLSWQN